MKLSAATSGIERADLLINAGRPLSEIALVFPNRIDALRYYAEFRHREFANPLGSECVACGQKATQEEVYTWEAIVNTSTTIFWSFLATSLALAGHRIVAYFHRIQFTTRHRFCSSCARAAKRNRLTSSILHYPLFGLLIISLLAAVPLTVFLAVALFAARDIALKAALLWLLSLGPLALGVAGFSFLRRLAIPAALRQVGRFPFRVFRVKRSSNSYRYSSRSPDENHQFVPRLD